MCLLGGWIWGAQASYSGFEARQTHPIAMTPDGSRVLALHSEGSVLSVFGLPSQGLGLPVLLHQIPVGLEPVSVRARTDTEGWVVNEVSDSVSIVSLESGRCLATLPCADEPADVAFAGRYAFVTCARRGVVRVIDAEKRTLVTDIPLAGTQPRSMAVSGDQSRVFVVFQNSGNGTTVIPASVAPAQPTPSNPNLPPAPDTALIVRTDDARVRYRVLDHDVAVIAVSDLRVESYQGGVGTTLLDVAVRPGHAELWVPNTEARNLVAFEPVLRGRVVDNRVTRLSLSDNAVTVFDLNPGVDYSVLPNPAAAAQALAQPTGIAFDAAGENAWVAAFGSDRIARVSVANGIVQERVDLRTVPLGSDPSESRWMRGPRGLVLDEARGRIYALNKISESLSVVDIATLQPVGELKLGSAQVWSSEAREGRAVLHDARRSGNGVASCASCHIDADLDGLAWDLGDPGGVLTTVVGANLAVHDTSPRDRVMHPMKGPMVTQTLRGIEPGALLHWRGDRATLNDFNATFHDLMGGDRVPAAAMDSLETYLASLRHHPNPHRTLSNTLPSQILGGDPSRGQQLYTAHINHCGVCHVLPSGSDNNIDDLRNFGGLQSIKTPSLRTTYQRMLLDTAVGATNTAGFGLLHDGTGGIRGLPTVHFYELDILNGAGFADVAAFIRAFDSGTPPAVGWNKTLQFEDLSSDWEAAALDILEQQAAMTNGCDLLVRGFASGLPRHFVFQPSTRLYLDATARENVLTRSQLLALVAEPGEALTFLGTPQGASLLLIPEPGTLLPSLSIQATQDGIELRWLAEPSQWVLERSDGPNSVWAPCFGVEQLGFGSFSWVLSNPIEVSGYFRLRRTW